MSDSVPMAKSATSRHDRAMINRVIAQRGLCGLANDTKRDEFITAMRVRESWRPKFRCKCVDSGPSYWDGEWFYHLPFPLISLEWLDVGFLHEARAKGQPPHVHVTDRSPWIEELLRQAGLEYQKGSKMIRIFGYSPKNLDLFDV